MLDKLSKRILKYMNENGGPPSETHYDFQADLDKLAVALSSDTESVRAAIRSLQKSEYIEFTKNHDGYAMYFSLDRKGLHWREYRRLEILHYLGDKWIDFFAMTASVASLILSVIALLLSQQQQP